MENTTYKRIYFIYNGQKYELRAQVPYRHKYLITLIKVSD